MDDDSHEDVDLYNTTRNNSIHCSPSTKFPTGTGCASLSFGKPPPSHVRHLLGVVHALNLLQGGGQFLQHRRLPTLVLPASIAESPAPFLFSHARCVRIHLHSMAGGFLLVPFRRAGTQHGYCQDCC